MQYRKLDAALSSALADPVHKGQQLAVFISFSHPLSALQVETFRAYGVHGAAPDRKVVTATLPASVIEAISDLPEVRSIRLSGVSRMLTQTAFEPQH